MKFLYVKTNYSLYIILALFIAFTLSSASLWPDDQDGVNYLLGIDWYDLNLHQPHFPGYPVYIAGGKILTILPGSSERACVIISVFSGAICLCLIAFIVEQRYSRKTALISVALLAVNPVFFEFSHKIFTEIPALALLLSAIALLGSSTKASGRKWFLSCAIIGLMLGIRLSWWPFALYYLIKGLGTGKGIFSFGGMTFGILIWLVPQSSMIGLIDLFQIGISFTFGHFNQWGGALGSKLGTDHRFISFATRVAEALGWFGTGTLWTRMPWVAFSFFCIARSFKKAIARDNEQLITLLGATLFYIVWAAIGQNTEKVRHLIPIIPVFIFLLAPFIEKYSKLLFSVIIIFSLTLPLDYMSRTENKPPAAQLRQWINSLSISNVAIYCGDSERFFDRYPSGEEVIGVPHIDKLMFTVKSSWIEPDTRFICDDIPGFKPNEKPIAVFPARKGDPVDRTLSLYELKL